MSLGPLMDAITAIQRWMGLAASVTEPVDKQPSESRYI